MTHLILEVGKFYRNGLGAAVMISGLVPTDDRRYRRGLRYVDHRGSFYTDTGSVQSAFYHKLDLFESIDSSDLTPTDKHKLAMDVKSMVGAMKKTASFYRFNRQVVTNSSAVCILLGLLMLPSRTRLAIGSIAAGVGGLCFNELTPEELYTFE